MQCYGHKSALGHKGCSCEGAASQLWGINVAKAYCKETDVVCRASVVWRDGGEQVAFVQQSLPGAPNLLEEREWVVGEVLAWLEQQVGGLSSTVCLMA